MKHQLFIFSFTIITGFCLGQDKTSKPAFSYPGNSIFIELAGNAVFYGSLNYERKFLQKNFFYLTGRTGIGYGGGSLLAINVLSVPIIVNGIFQIYHSVALEVGIGVSFMQIGRTRGQSPYDKWTYENDVVPTGIAGLRIQAKNGFLFRADFTPYITDLGKIKTADRFYPSFGISFGYSFGRKKN